MNLMVTMLLSGFWHGAEWHYVAWGGVHSLYQITGEMTRKWREQLRSRWRIDVNSTKYVIVQQIFTFIFVDIAWIFFRSGSVMSAIEFLKGMLFDFQITRIFRPGEIIQVIGITPRDAIIVIVGMFALFAIDVLGEKHDSYIFLHSQNWLIRWSVYFLLVFSILLLGYYGYDYVQT